MREKVMAWFDGLPDSTQRALKTLWQAFVGTFCGTFLLVLCEGLMGGLIGGAEFKALLLSALSAAIAALAAKVWNWLKSDESLDPEIYEKEE